MEFCPKCNMRIIKFVRKNGEDLGICANGHETQIDHSTTDTNKKTDRKYNRENALVIIDSKIKTGEDTMITSIFCPYCEAKKCKLLLSFMFTGDEENVNIMNCLNCGKNFRVGTGLSGH